jgi:hypothetical protein
MDDTFSVELSKNMMWYAPYSGYYPRKQVLLLELFDDLEILHEKSKQECGLQLTIIGFCVNPNQLSISLPEESRF